MSFEKRIKKLGNKKLDSIVPKLYTQHKKKNISCWYKFSFSWGNVPGLLLSFSSPKAS